MEEFRESLKRFCEENKGKFSEYGNVLKCEVKDLEITANKKDDKYNVHISAKLNGKPVSTYILGVKDLRIGKEGTNILIGGASEKHLGYVKIYSPEEEIEAVEAVSRENNQNIILEKKYITEYK